MQDLDYVSLIFSPENMITLITEVSGFINYSILNEIATFIWL